MTRYKRRLMQRPMMLSSLLTLSFGGWYILGGLMICRAPTKSSTSFNVMNNGENETFSKDKWINISQNVHIFSAYFDYRSNDALYGDIQIMGFENESWHGLSYCVFVYDNNVRLCSKERPRKTHLRPKQHHSATMYSCRLPSIQIPVAVGVAFDEKCNSLGNSVFTKVTTRYEKRSQFMKEFGVCIHSPLFDMNDPQFVAEYIEMNTLLGAEWFTGYVASASAQVWVLLKSYVRLVEVVDWGTNLPSSRYAGQDLSVQDCLYRNMYKVKYLVYADLDELIFPIKHPNWHEMMQELDDGNTGVFYFQHLAFFENIDDRNVTKIRDEHAICSGGDAIPHLRVLRYLSYTLKTTTIFEKKRKIMLKPVAVHSLRIHSASNNYGKQLLKTIDVEDAIMCHFRSSGLERFKKGTVYFNKIQQHVPRILDKVRKRLCNLPQMNK